jgi:DNA-binding CsgD family transcriptional regulator
MKESGALFPERSTELRRVSAFFENAQESALLIAASYGSGKTRLLEAIAADAPWRVHRVRINPKESRLRFSGLSTIVAAFHSPEAIALSEKLLSPSAGHARPEAQASELLEFFHRRDTEFEVLLVDDIDLMDPASQRVISMVLSRLDGSRLRVIGAASAIPQDGPLASLAHMGLSPLNFNESLRLLSSLAGPSADEAILRMVSSASSGNPGALLHNLAALSSTELAGNEAITLPFRPRPDPSPTQPIRMNPLAAQRRALLARLSCARLSSYDAIASQQGSTAGTLEGLLGDGSVLRQGRYIRIRDPLVRARVYWSLDATSRADYHAMAAASEEPHDPELAAWHRSRISPGGATADELLRAATRFTGLGYVAQGIEFAEHALTVDRNAFGRVDGLIDYVESLFLRGELNHAERYARIARGEAGTGGTSSALTELRTRIEFMSTQRLPPTTDGGVPPSDGEHPTADTAQNLAVTAIRHAELWELDAARSSLERARAAAPTASPALATTIARAELMISALTGDAGPANALYDELAHHGPGSQHPQHLIVLGQSLTLLQEHTRARRVFKAILELENSLDPIWRDTTRYALAENEILAGNQLEALSVIDLLNITNSTSPLHRNIRRVLMAWYWQAVDNRAAADAAIAECHHSFTSDDNLALTARLECYRGGFALARGRLDDAVALLRSATVYGGSLSIPALLSYWVDLIEACVLSGREVEAAERFQEFHQRVALHRTRWTVLADARAAALASIGEPSLSAFERAIELWKPGDSRFELGRMLMSYGDRLTSLGRARDGREQYLAARILFTQHGAASWAARADALRRREGQDAPAHPLLSSLTPEERLVATLACRGLRNKEIAAELFLSQRTVEVRLTRIYHALGVRSRAEMIGALSWLDAPEGGHDHAEEHL